MSRCLRHCVTKMLDRHSIVFNGMMNRLRVDRNSDLKFGFHQLAEELFVRDVITWGKIVALFAFGARLAQHCGQNGLGDLVFDIATILAQFAVDRLTPFLKEHGGWVRKSAFKTIPPYLLIYHKVMKAFYHLLEAESFYGFRQGTLTNQALFVEIFVIEMVVKHHGRGLKPISPKGGYMVVATICSIQ